MSKEIEAIKPKSKPSREKIITIVASAILILAHIAILLAILWSWRYYSIMPTLFGSAVGIIVCSMVIIDIVFFVGFNHKDTVLKIISTVMAILLIVFGTAFDLSRLLGVGTLNIILRYVFFGALVVALYLYGLRITDVKKRVNDIAIWVSIIRKDTYKFRGSDDASKEGGAPELKLPEPEEIRELLKR